MNLISSRTIGFVGMVEGWTGTIDVAVREGYVSYVATGDDPGAHGVAEISGNASFYVFPTQNHQNFRYRWQSLASRHRKQRARRIRTKGDGRM